MIERLIKWGIMAAGEHLDPSSVPPEGSGRPKPKRRHVVITGIVGGAILAAKACQPFVDEFASEWENETSQNPPTQEVKRANSNITTSAHMEKIQTPQGLKEYMVLPPFAIANIQNNNYLRNGTSFMEIGIDIPGLHNLYTSSPPIIPPDRINRHIELWLPDAPKGVSTGNSQVHFISMRNMLYNNPFLTNFGPDSIQKRNLFFNTLELELNAQLLMHLRYSPEELEDPGKKDEINLFASRTIVNLNNLYGPAGFPLKVINFNFSQAQTELQAPTN